MQITTTRNLGGLYDEVPKIAQLRRIECERACEKLGIPYDAAADGAYILQRRLASLPEADVLRAAGRNDLLDDAEKAGDMAEAVTTLKSEVDELKAMNERLMAALEGKSQERAAEQPASAVELPKERSGLANYETWKGTDLKHEVKVRGLPQKRDDSKEMLIERLRNHDAGHSIEMEHPDGNASEGH